MPSKKYAISTPAATTAMWYGKNVSQGILAMERVIEKQRVMLTSPKKKVR